MSDSSSVAGEKEAVCKRSPQILVPAQFYTILLLTNDISSIETIDMAHIKKHLLKMNPITGLELIKALFPSELLVSEAIWAPDRP